MARKQRVEFVHPNVLLVITVQGTLIELFTPIRAQVIKDIAGLNKGTFVHIEAIVKSKEHKLLYCIVGKWYPYHHFKVGGK